MDRTADAHGAGARRALLEREIVRRGSLSVVAAAALVEVSEMTIRRDFDALDEAGRVLRVRGGAVARVSRAHEPPLAERAGRAGEAKRLIAAAAAALVDDGDTIILDVGSTALELAHALRGRSALTVLTASLPAALALADQPGIRVIVTGGIVRAGETSLVGALAERAFDGFNCDTLFLGVGGIDLAKGLTEFNPDDARVKQAAIASARQVVVLADEAKLGAVAFARIAPVTAAHVLVGDAPPHHPVAREVADAGVRYVQAVETGAAHG